MTAPREGDRHRLYDGEDSHRPRSVPPGYPADEEWPPHRDDWPQTCRYCPDLIHGPRNKAVHMVTRHPG